MVGLGLVMSHYRAWEPQNIGDETAPKTRSSMGKSAGDSAPDANYQTQPKRNNQSNRNKNKVPQSIRYDLENALIGVSIFYL